MQYEGSGSSCINLTTISVTFNNANEDGSLSTNSGDGFTIGGIAYQIIEVLGAPNWSDQWFAYEDVMANVYTIHGQSPGGQITAVSLPRAANGVFLNANHNPRIDAAGWGSPRSPIDMPGVFPPICLTRGTWIAPLRPGCGRGSAPARSGSDRRQRPPDHPLDRVDETVGPETGCPAEYIRPIRIRTGSPGRSVPTTDLTISPQHRIPIRSRIARNMFGADEVLIAVKHLLELYGVEYFHMFFDRHEVIISNAARTESFHTGPQALKSVSSAARKEMLHGGAIMGLADSVGGTAAIINLPGGMSTTTIESKTNFLRPIRVGDIVRAASILLHRGRKTMIVQTTITRGDGKVAAIVTQTQMVMAWETPPAQGCG